MADFFVQYGLYGLFFSSFLAGSAFPLGSEIIYTYLFNSGSNPYHLLLVATLGNWLGSMTNYYLGTLGKWEWISKYLRVKREKIESSFKYVHKYDFYAALLCWLPILGTPIALALGFLKSDLKKVSIYMFIGKFIRYLILWLILEGILMV